MSGAESIKLNLHDKNQDEKLWSSAEAFQGEPGTVYVFGHGSPDGITDDRNGKGAGSEKLSPQALALILEDLGATPETKVVLVSCSTGKGQHSFARELSRYFSEVEAPTRELWVNGANSAEELRVASGVHGKNPEGEANTDDAGKIKQFHASDYQYCQSNPEVCDSPESERPTPGTIRENGVYTSARDTGGDDQPLISADSSDASRPVSAHSIQQADVEAANQYLEAVRSGDTSGLPETLQPVVALRVQMLDKVHQVADGASRPVNESPAVNAIDAFIAANIRQGNLDNLVAENQRIEHESSVVER